jgi:hypothetical protein
MLDEKNFFIPKQFPMVGARDYLRVGLNEYRNENPNGHLPFFFYLD